MDCSKMYAGVAASSIFLVLEPFRSNWLYEDTDLRLRLMWGVERFFACRFVLRDALTINSSAIESRDIELFKKPKIIKIRSRNAENARFTFGANGTIGNFY